MGLIAAWWLVTFACGLSAGYFWAPGVWLLLAAAAMIYLPERRTSTAWREFALWSACLLNGLLAFAVTAAAPDLTRIEAGWAEPWIEAMQCLTVLGLVAYARPVRSLLPRWVQRGIFCTVAGSASLAALLAVLGVPDPNIDVFNFLTEGARGLLQGRNPYAMEFTPVAKPIGPGYLDPAYHFVYSYLPGTVLLTLPSVLLGDVRWVMLGATVMSAFLLRRLALRSGAGEPIADLVGIGVLTYTGLPYVVQNAWPEPLVVCLWLGALVALHSARHSWAVALAGLVLSVKQYNPPLLAPLLEAGMRRRQVLASLLLPIGLCAAFWAWGPKDFWWDALGYQMQVPVRPDALSMSAYLLHATGRALPGLVSVAVPLAAGALLCYRALRRPRLGDTTRLTAGFYLVLFLFSKFAFANYYFLLQSLLLAGIAVDAAGAAIVPGVTAAASTLSGRQ